MSLAQNVPESAVYEALLIGAAAAVSGSRGRRAYDGLMSSGTARATFTRMQDGTAEEYALINAREAAYNRTLHRRVLDAVRALGSAEPDPGYAVSRLAHSLQSATRAERDGRPVDYVVAALIHDIGDGLAPYSHGSYAAAVLRPFVSEELCWIVSHHPLFQMHYYGAQTADDANARDAYLEHPWFDATVEFCERYDENCFDPGYGWLPLEHFAPVVEEVFSREPAFR
jgi:predicted HD phosphohydrolase